MEKEEVLTNKQIKKKFTFIYYPPQPSPYEETLSHWFTNMLIVTI